MPLYEYECIMCDHHFERRQGFHEEPIGECPVCGGKARRVLHVVPVLFKGSGFYATDNRKGGGGDGSAGKSEKKEQETGGGGKGKEVGATSDT